MTHSKGYYCLIQFCPDLARLEAANIGVLLFCPDKRFIKARTAQGNDRIRRFFGSEGQDWEQLNTLKMLVEERLEVEKENFVTLEDLEQFIATRANEIQITHPRPMVVSDPDQDLQILFDKLIGGRANRAVPKPVKKTLRQIFEKEGLQPRLEKDITVTVKAFHCELIVPFAFHNGRLNLIQPVPFHDAKPGGAIARACRYAVEGHSLYLHPDPQRGDLQLVVVAGVGAEIQDALPVIRDMMTENQVKFFTLDETESLIYEIKNTAKVLSH